ncbi:hypothetical protein [Cellvibrio fibrivorans]|uniref:Uncharacterized protein n=1 Tax=Cellvibrio fibrivorans TaxID=126350 RepID=A0ABU1UXD7_9GAMM|nr:hypothetical protein [Cellvibrio fibrivorans]MDR7089813.1 hypothetical protein [Cellvibrio fibrivorans]
MMTIKPYVKTLQDELDWKLLDQLHGAVAQISNFCFEIKKFCVTTLFVAMTLIIKFTSDKLDLSIFVTGLVIPLCFWFLDATGYFYQVKIRGAMEAIRIRLSSRGEEKIVVALSGHVIELSRISAPRHKRILSAAFNHSMWLYLLLVAIDLLLLALYLSGAFK